MANTCGFYFGVSDITFGDEDGIILTERIVLTDLKILLGCDPSNSYPSSSRSVLEAQQKSSAAYTL